MLMCQLREIETLFESNGQLVKNVYSNEKISEPGISRNGLPLMRSVVSCFYDHDWAGTRTELFDLIRTTASSICTRLQALNIDIGAWWRLEEEIVLLR
jgi:hypothetical protein